MSDMRTDCRRANVEDHGRQHFTYLLKRSKAHNLPLAWHVPLLMVLEAEERRSNRPGTRLPQI